MKPLAWFEFAGFLAVGGAGAYAFVHFNRQPRVGDVVTASIEDLQIPGAQRAAPEVNTLFALLKGTQGGFTQASVKIEGIAGDQIQGTATVSGMPAGIPVFLDKHAIRSLVRDGKQINL